MKAFTLLAALSAAATALAQNTLFINTPVSIVQCQPVLLTYGGGTAPYFISIIPGGQAGAAALEQLPEQSGTTYTWTADIAAGTNITLSIRDSTGAVNYGSPVVIQSSSDSSCLGQNGAGGSGGSGGSASSSAAATSSSISVATTSAASSTLVSSAPSATVTAAAGDVTGNITQSNGTSVDGSSSYNFTCSQGDLTYGITTAVLRSVPLETVTGALANWTAAAPGLVLNSTGEGVGAQRTYTLAGNNNITFSETLITNNTNSTSGSLHQQWNFTEATPVVLSPNLTMFDAFNDLTAYTNTTTNETNVQYFILACFDNQAAGLSTLASLIEGTISYYADALSNSTSGGSSNATARSTRRSVRLF